MTLYTAPRAHALDRTQRTRRFGAAFAVVALAASMITLATAPAHADSSPETITVSVFFDAGKAVLTDTAKASLDVFLLDLPADATDVSTSVVGWVQETRSKANDRRLSTARARNVASYLTAQGLQGDIAAEGRGIKNRTVLARTASVAITFTAATPPAPAAPTATVPCRIPSTSVSMGAAALNVTFVLGCDGGSPITSVQYNRDGTWVTVPPSGPFSMPELVAGTTKSFKIRAVNAVGPGPAWEVPTPGPVSTCTAPVYLGGAHFNWQYPDAPRITTVSRGSWSGEPTFTYQWYDGAYGYSSLTPAVGQTGTSYQSDGDVSVQVTATDGACSTSIMLLGWYHGW